jgi:hypothetical protein
MSVEAVLSSFTRFNWVPDHVRAIVELRPRHIGAPVTFEHFATQDPTNYDSETVLGSFEGIHGATIVVSGFDYEWNNISNMKVWRTEIKK